MEQFANSAIIAGLVSNFLPIEDTSIRLQSGLIISQIINYFLGEFNINIFNFFKKSGNRILINSKYDDNINPIYYNLEEYIIKKYVSNLKNLELIPKNGEITFSSLQEDTIELQDNYNDHIIDLIFSSNKSKKSDDNKKNTSEKNIELFQKPPCEDLKKYAENICLLNKPISSIISIYKIKTIPFEKKDTLEWESIYVKTNKNYNNTIVSEDINKELFIDVKKFLSNEEWFSNKGIPYKKGYLLYGPPGTGKTSIIKAIANTEQLPIFNLDLSTIKSNAEMLKLVTDINYLAKNKKYMVSIEDIDRCPQFSRSCDRYRQLENNTLSIDCLLNVLDGMKHTR